MTAFNIWGNAGNEAFAMPMVKLAPTLPNSQGYILAWDTVNQGLNYFPLAIDSVTGYMDIIADSAVPVVMASAPLQIVGSQNGYLQLDIRNANSGALASSDVVATANTGTDSLNYVNLGINGSNYVDPTWTINGALDAYLYASDGALSIGTKTAKEFNIFTGGTLLANKRLAISAIGDVVMNTNVAVPALAVNQQMVFNLTTNTNLRVSVRGTDGVTRVSNIVLA
jgi:hypothetical protein